MEVKTSSWLKQREFNVRFFFLHVFFSSLIPLRFIRPACRRQAKYNERSNKTYSIWNPGIKHFFFLNLPENDG